MIDIRKGQAPAPLDRDTFSVRFRAAFQDPAFRSEDTAIARMEAIAWDGYIAGRKAPQTRPAGAGYADPNDMLSAEWIATKKSIDEAQARWGNPDSPSRVLLICGSARNDGTCPGEMSKSFRLLQMARENLESAHVQTDVLDLSRLTSEYGLNIYPCKGCVSTAMPLCHWPCSCYPNHALNQTNDWMAEIYARWTVHGDVAGIDDSRRALSDWLDWMGFMDAGAQARLDRYIGYYEPYASSHEALDKDEAVQEEVRNVAHCVASAVVGLRAGGLQAAQPEPKRPRQK